MEKTLPYSSLENPIKLSKDIQSEPVFNLFSHASLNGLGKMAKKKKKKQIVL